LKSGQVAIQQGLLISILDGHLLDEQIEIDLIASEDFEEPGRIQANLVNGDVANLALDVANLVDLGPHRVSQLLNHFGCEANAHELVANGRLGLVVGRRTIAIGLEGSTHLVEVLFDDREFFQSRLLALF